MYNCSKDAAAAEEIYAFPPKTPLAMCYVPFQKYGEIYPENVALEKATIFPDLYFPFKGKGVGDNE